MTVLPDEPLRDRLQSTLGAAYALGRELGGGGMARVFVAHEAALGRDVVVKVLAPDLAAGLSAERFGREIRLAASLQQANIVPVLTAGATDGIPYYTMPYVAGESLRARLHRDGPMPVAQAVDVLKDVARALQYAHERGIVHRDIKPDNVLLSGGTAVVTDFGIAKAIAAAVSRADRDDGSEPTALTQFGTSIGTPAYMAPEQAAGDPDVDQRADVYAFGCLAYELLAGQPPFHGRTPQRVLAAHLSELPKPVVERRPDVPPALAALVMRCLEKDAAARPQTASELIAALGAVTSGGALPAMPAPGALGALGSGATLRRALLVYVVTAAVVALAVVAASIVIGLPDWVVPTAIVLLALGLPAIGFTGYVQHAAHRALVATPTYTPGGGTKPHGTMASIALRASPHVSWRRTWVGGAVALATLVIAVVGYMTLRALGIGPAGSLFARGALARRDRILVADFRAPAADSSLGAVVAEAVRTNLAQSTAISIVPPSVVAAALGRMQRPPTTRVDLALGRELAQREGIKAVVDGQVSQLGASFLVTAHLVSAESGDELATFSEGAKDATDLIPAIDRVTRKLRGKMGESLKAVHDAPPLASVTTASLPALRKFTEAYRANYVEVDWPKAAALAEEAIRIDTGFAMAYTLAARAVRNAGFSPGRRDSLSRMAFERRERLPERERAQVEATHYYSPTRGDRSKALAAYERAVALDSADGTLWHAVALILASQRQYARAAAYETRAIAAGGNTAAWGTKAQALINQGELEAADHLLDTLQARAPTYAPLPLLRAMVWSARGRMDSVAAACVRATRTTNPQTRAQGVGCGAVLALYHGKLGAYERIGSEYVALTSGRTGQAQPFVLEADSSFDDAWFRDRAPRAVQRLDAALARTPLASIPPASRPHLELVRTYAMAGRPDRARAMLAQYDGDVRDTVTRRIDGATRRAAEAEIALAERRYDDAIDLFRRADVEYDGRPVSCPICLLPRLARAYDLAGRSDSAIAIYDRYLRTPYTSRAIGGSDGRYLAATLKRLGELYEARRDYPKAADAYARFVDLWKDADADLQPQVRDVRQRLARLHVRSG